METRIYPGFFAVGCTLISIKRVHAGRVKLKIQPTEKYSPREKPNEQVLRYTFVFCARIDGCKWFGPCRHGRTLRVHRCRLECPRADRRPRGSASKAFNIPASVWIA